MQYIYLLCYNESILLPHTIKHYKTYLPNCHITVYDNMSTDNSVEIAKSLGCDIITWDSQNIINDFMYLKIKNNCWKSDKDGWVIIADMDEWLCITEEQLNKEERDGTTILNIEGYNMIGNSMLPDLSDIDLHSIDKGILWKPESKKMCFLNKHIKEINYQLGAHKCNPIGNIRYGNNIYINKHMEYLGLPFIINKMNKRYERSENMRKLGYCTHYTNNIKKILEIYNNYVMKSKKINL